VKFSRKVKAALAVVVLVVVVFGVFAAITYPKTVVDLSVSFTIGADRRVETFGVPLLHSLAQVEVWVASGTALWSAKIESASETLWSHSAAQSGQTTYTSEWIPLTSGGYNITFGTLGFGSLEAEVKVTTKGGFW
jgi:hypothetical protein